MAVHFKPSVHPSAPLSVRLSVWWGGAGLLIPAASTVFQSAFHPGALQDLFIWPQNNAAHVRKTSSVKVNVKPGPEQKYFENRGVFSKHAAVSVLGEG